MITSTFCEVGNYQWLPKPQTGNEHFKDSAMYKTARFRFFAGDEKKKKKGHEETPAIKKQRQIKRIDQLSIPNHAW